MTLVALITDTHFGCRGDDQIFARYIDNFYNEQFFPYLEKNKIDHIIHLGDIMDRRKYVNFLTAKQVRQTFLERCNNEGINTHIIIGNHDTFYKTTNDVNSMNELAQAYRKKVSWYSETSTININGTGVLLVPWINTENFDSTMKKISDSDAHICLGHLELQGFGMYKGIINHDGLNPDVFSKFHIVCSGHFHHKSSKRNIHYLGAPYEITWSDYNDDRGFHILDLDTFQLSHIVNTVKMFYKIGYDDSKITKKDIGKMDFKSLKDKHVKIIITEKNDPYLFDMLIEKIEEVGVADMQVVEDHKHLDVIDDTEIVDETSDTLTIMKEYIKNRPEILEPERVNRIVSQLYNEALEK